MSAQSTRRWAEKTIESSLAAGWPEPNTAYGRLVTMEQTASRLTDMGSVPGTLLSLGYVVAQQQRARIPTDVAKTRNELHRARQALVAARVASGELAVTSLIRVGALEQISRQDRDLGRTQAVGLLGAMERGGWDIQLVNEHAAGRIIPPRVYGIVLGGDPAAPDCVYQEFQGEGPYHEAWDEGTAATAQVAHTYQQLSETAMDANLTREQLERYVS